MEHNYLTGYTYLTDLMAGMKIDNIEQSVKISAGKITANRFLTGLSTRKLDICTRDRLLKTMNIPPECEKAINQYYDLASSILFGYESSANGKIFLKVYLEFWEALTEKISQKHPAKKTELMHLGYKWDHLQNQKYHLTEYYCYPLLNLRQIQRHISENICTNSLAGSDKTAQAILNIAAMKAHDRSFVYLEAIENDNCRKSIDLNLYKAELTIADIVHPLTRYLEHCQINNPESIVHQYAPYTLGHISAGKDRHNNDFFTFYIELP